MDISILQRQPEKYITPIFGCTIQMIVLSDRWYLLTAYRSKHNYVSWISGIGFTSRFEENDLC